MVRTLPRSTLEQLPTLVQVERTLAALTSEQLKAASLENARTLKAFHLQGQAGQGHQADQNAVRAAVCER